MVSSCLEAGKFLSLIHRSEKIDLTCSSVVYISIYRLFTILAINNTASWTLARADTWAIYETCAGIISGNLLTMRPFFLAVFNLLRPRRNVKRQDPRTTYLRASREFDASMFRPAGELKGKHDVQTTVRDDSCADDIPLHSIRVQHETTWQESIDDTLPSPTTPRSMTILR